MCTFCYLVFSCYTAILTSTMISKPSEVVLGSLRELVDNGHSIVIWKNTATHALFRDAPQGTEFAYVFEKSVPLSFFPGSNGSNKRELCCCDSVQMVFFNLCRLMKDNPRSMGSTQEEMIHLLMTEPSCIAYDTPITYLGLNNVTEIKGFEGEKKSPYSLVLAKDSELKQVLDYHIMQVMYNFITSYTRTHDVYFKNKIVGTLTECI